MKRIYKNETKLRLLVDVDIYHKAGEVVALKPCIEADKFCAYWSLESYENFPHALITLYENKP